MPRPSLHVHSNVQTRIAHAHSPRAARDLSAHAAVSARRGHDALSQARREGVRVETVLGEEVIVVAREALRALAEAAFTDINHLLRPAHLEQLRAILDDPEASDNDKFVAYDFLKNANIAAGGVLPMCQDTGTAIIMGKKGRLVWTDGERRGGARRGRARCLPQEEPALLAARAALDVRGEEHRKQHAGAGRDLCRGRRRRAVRLQVSVHRQGRRLRQQVVPVPGDALDPHPRAHAGLPQGEGAHARHRGLPALSPRDRDRRHLGGADDENRQARLDQILRQPADRRARRTATPFAILRWSGRSTA